VTQGTQSGEPAIATLELATWMDERVVQDLGCFERVWLIFAFHLKPYIPYADAFPEAGAGWIDEMNAKLGRRSAAGPRKPREQ